MSAYNSDFVRPISPTGSGGGSGSGNSLEPVMTIAGEIVTLTSGDIVMVIVPIGE